MSKSILRDGLILGLGNPLLDISANVDNTFLEKYDLLPDNACLAEDKHQPIYQELIEKYNADFIAGGSVQNSFRVAQWVLERPNTSVFFGCVGNDKFSNILEEKARSDGVDVHYQVNPEQPTGTCAVLITGTHRSLCANLAAANHFTVDHVKSNKSFLEAAEYYYISGFFLTVNPESIMMVAQYALSQNRLFMMNLSAPFIAQFYKKPLMEALPYVDILFGNETEAQTFANELDLSSKNKDLKAIALEISNLPKLKPDLKRIVVITQGKEPVILVENNKITEFPVVLLEHEKIIDTNGAGDAFVGGFLSQLLMKRPLEVCIRCGIWAATKIIQRSGCTFEGKPDFVE